jgi:dTDP-4-amino-4,6-dideoxygalactose transaminase
MAIPPIIPLFGVVRDASGERDLLAAIHSGGIASGHYAEAFRTGFGAAIGNDKVVITSDMSSAISIALHLAGVTADSEVICSPFACMSTNAPVGLSGARIRWADLDPRTATVPVSEIARLITARTKAVLLYHVAGYPAPVAEIAALCREAHVALIEDCDNALGAEYGGRQVGSFGDFAVYSFYPNRQINGLEGGALACRRAEDYERACKLRRFGLDPARMRDRTGEIDPALDAPEIGWAATMSNAHSAYALPQLGNVEARLRKTRENVEQLRAALVGARHLEIVEALPGATPAYWVLLARTGGRDECLAALKGAGISASKLHQPTDVYSGFNAERRPLPGVRAFAETAFALPCGWWLDAADVGRIAATVREIAGTFGECIAVPG